MGRVVGAEAYREHHLAQAPAVPLRPVEGPPAGPAAGGVPGSGRSPRHLLTARCRDLAQARTVLRALDDEVVAGDLQVEDAVVVERHADGQVHVTPWVHQGALEVGAGALLGGAIGSLLLAPLLGAVLGAATGAVRASVVDLGLADGLVQQLAHALPAGATAVLVLADLDRTDRVDAVLLRCGVEPKRVLLSGAGGLPTDG